MEEKEKQPLFEKVSDWYRDLPNKKQYVEFVTAILSVPVLVTVIISNVSNLRAKDNVEGATTPTPTTIIKYITGETQDPEKNEKPSPTPTPTENQTPTPAMCKKEVGPVDISYPEENGVVTENPVTVTISYTPGEFCAVVWSYRINGGNWSPFDDKSIALYGMTAGEKKLELKVKSIASGAEKTLTRNFSYQPPVEASDSAELSQ